MRQSITVAIARDGTTTVLQAPSVLSGKQRAAFLALKAGALPDGVAEVLLFTDPRRLRAVAVEPGPKPKAKK